MVAAASAVLTVVFLLIARLLLRDEPSPPAVPSFTGRGKGPAWWLAFGVVATSQLPLLLAGSTLLITDASGHAAIAQDLARHGARHGWVDVFNGGFPLGPHYPPLGWLLAAGLIRLGLDAAFALNLLAYAAIAVAPLLVTEGGRRLGATPAAATAAGLAFGCVAPFTPFVGGWKAYLEEGLFAQAIATPILVAWLVALARPAGARWPAPVLAALGVAAHPQLAVAFFVVGGVARLAAGTRTGAGALVRSGVAAIATAAALYAPGVLTLKAPFGWPPMAEWKLIGLPASKVLRFLGDGEMLDVYRFPVLTLAWGAAIAVALWTWRERASRLLLAATAVALLAAISGTFLSAAGRAGELLLGFLQPLRAMAVLPVVAAGATLYLLEVVIAAVTSRYRAYAESASRPPPAWLRRAAPWALVGASLCPAVLSTVEYGHSVAIRHDAWRGQDWCDGDKPSGYASREIERWVRDLARPRFTIARDEPLKSCPQTLGVELAAEVALGRPIGAGAHVGVNHVAFRQLHPGRPDAADRAESIGIRSVLHTRDRPMLPPERWRVVAESGDMMMSERVGGTDLVGVGCVEREISGAPPAIAEALYADLEHPDGTLLSDPHRLVRLTFTDGPARGADVAKSGCDPTGAIVDAVPREPGAYEARISLRAPADVVVRASAFPTWVLRVDGAEVPAFVIAPGFVGARVQAGEHVVTAVVAPPRGYAAGIGAALFVVLAAGVPWPRRRRARSRPAPDPDERPPGAGHRDRLEP